jgi:sulfatase maturation enzyme AslB (radical SAM superfamily)
MCHHPMMRRPKGVMPFELWRRCADQIRAEAPATECWLSFCGEPLMEPELLVEMLRYGRSIGLESLNVNTNGMLLTEDLVEPLLNSGAHLVVFGLDGFTRETYERIRLKGNRDVVYENVERFLKARGADGPAVQVQFIEMSENWEEFDQFRAYWLERGAIVKFRKMLSWGGKFHTPQEGVGNAWQSSLVDLWAALGRYRQFHLQYQFDELPARCHSCHDWMTGAALRIRPEREAQVA